MYVAFFLLIKYSNWFFVIDLIRDQTPPNTPQRARAATRQNERNSRNLDSPEQRRIPQNPVFPQIAPIHFDNVPIPQLPPVPVNAIVPDDPFALPPAPVYLNGREYRNLPQNLAEQVQNLAAFPAAGRGRGRGRGQLPPVSVLFYVTSFFKTKIIIRYNLIIFLHILRNKWLLSLL
jgi:hypothetical protein